MGLDTARELRSGDIGEVVYVRRAIHEEPHSALIAANASFVAVLETIIDTLR